MDASIERERWAEGNQVLLVHGDVFGHAAIYVHDAHADARGAYINHALLAEIAHATEWLGKHNDALTLSDFPAGRNFFDDTGHLVPHNHRWDSTSGLSHIALEIGTANAVGFYLDEILPGL